MRVRAETGKSLTELLKIIQSKYGEYVNGTFSVTCSESLKEPVMKRLSSEIPDHLGGFEVSSIRRIDGIKIILKSGAWLLIRPSGTDPFMRVYAEASDKRNLDAILEEGRNFLSRATSYVSPKSSHA